MSKPLAFALAAAALVLAAVVGYLSLGRGAPPSTTAIPASADAVPTTDGAEVTPS